MASFSRPPIQAPALQVQSDEERSGRPGRFERRKHSRRPRYLKKSGEEQKFVPLSKTESFSVKVPLHDGVVSDDGELDYICDIHVKVDVEKAIQGIPEHINLTFSYDNRSYFKTFSQRKINGDDDVKVVTKWESFRDALLSLKDFKGGLPHMSIEFFININISAHFAFSKEMVSTVIFPVPADKDRRPDDEDLISSLLAQISDLEREVSQLQGEKDEILYELLREQAEKRDLKGTLKAIQEILDQKLRKRC